MIDLVASLFILAAPEAGMIDEDNRAVELEVSKVDDRIEVSLLSRPGKQQRLRYSLEVNGSSTSKHRGSTSVTGQELAVLSTIRVLVGVDWCVRALIEEESGETYELVEGPCRQG